MSRRQPDDGGFPPLAPFGPLACGGESGLPVGLDGPCRSCGALLRPSPAGLLIDPTAARAELFAAADGCAGGWTLRSVVGGPTAGEADPPDAYRRLARAESCMAALVRQLR